MTKRSLSDAVTNWPVKKAKFLGGASDDNDSAINELPVNRAGDEQQVDEITEIQQENTLDKEQNDGIGNGAHGHYLDSQSTAPDGDATIRDKRRAFLQELENKQAELKRQQNITGKSSTKKPADLDDLGKATDGNIFSPPIRRPSTAQDTALPNSVPTAKTFAGAGAIQPLATLNKTLPSLTDNAAPGAPGGPPDGIPGPAQAHAMFPRHSTGKVFPDPNMADNAFVNFWYEQLALAESTPKGMKNPNVLCYRNGVLTAILNSRNFVRYLRDWFIAREQSQVANNDIHILTWLYRLVGLAVGSDKDAEFQKEVKDMWKHIGFPRGSSSGLLPSGAWGDDAGCDGIENNQQDAEAFLQWLYRAILRQMEMTKDTAPSLNWKWVTTTRLVSHLICPNCNKWLMRSDNVEELPVVGLQIPQPQNGELMGPSYAVNLEMLLARALHTKVAGSCKVCRKELVENTKQRKRFQYAPAVLTLRIGRGLSSCSSVKDTSTVHLPKTLDISQWLNEHQYGPGSKVRYSLSAIIVHKGTNLGSGHYTSYVRTSSTNNALWTEVDDGTLRTGFDLRSDKGPNHVTIVASDHLRPETPYILIYDRIFNKSEVLPGREPQNVRDWDMEDGQTGDATGQNEGTPATSAHNSGVISVQVLKPLIGSPGALDEIFKAAATAMEKFVHDQEPANVGKQPGPIKDVGENSGVVNIHVSEDHEAKQNEGYDITRSDKPRAMSDPTPKVYNAAPFSARPEKDITANGNATLPPVKATAVPASTSAPSPIMVSGLPAESNSGQATVDINLKIDGIDFHTPQFGIDHFDPKKHRDIEISATLTAPKIQTKAQTKKNSSPPDEELDLIDAALEPKLTNKIWQKEFAKKGSTPARPQRRTPPPAAVEAPTHRVTRSAVAAARKREDEDGQGKLKAKKGGKKGSPSV